MWSIHRGQKSKHITPTPKRPPLGTPPAAARQLHAQRSGFIVGEAICLPFSAVMIRRWRAVNDRPYDKPSGLRSR